MASLANNNFAPANELNSLMRWKVYQPWQGEWFHTGSLSYQMHTHRSTRKHAGCHDWIHDCQNHSTGEAAIRRCRASGESARRGTILAVCEILHTQKLNAKLLLLILQFGITVLTVYYRIIQTHNFLKNLHGKLVLYNVGVSCFPVVKVQLTVFILNIAFFV